jgi:tetratricopeptide (TPR) repeat protein
MAQGKTNRRTAPKNHPVRNSPRESDEESDDQGVRFDPEVVAQETIKRMKPHLKLIGAAIIAVIIVLVGRSLIAQSHGTTEGVAYAKLHKAIGLIKAIDFINVGEVPELIDEQKEILADVIENHAGSLAAVEAEYHLAKVDFLLEDFGSAQTRFAAFYATHDDHELAPAARLGEANSLYAEAKYEEAFTKFKALADDASVDAVSVRARQSARSQAANCAAVLGRLDDARALLEANLDSIGANEDAIKSVQSAIRRLEILPPLKDGIDKVIAAVEASDALPKFPNPGDATPSLLRRPFEGPNLDGSGAKPKPEGSQKKQEGSNKQATPAAAGADTGGNTAPVIIDATNDLENAANKAQDLIDAVEKAEDAVEGVDNALDTLKPAP